MTAVQANYFDGEIAHDRIVTVELTPTGLAFSLADGRQKAWTFGGLRAVDPPSPGHPLRLSHDSDMGARLSLPEGAFVNELVARVPHLKGALNPRRAMRIGGMAAASLAAVAAAIYLLFTFAPEKLAFLMPDEWRSRLGEATERTFVAEARRCTNSDGQAALDRLAARIREGNPDLPGFSLHVYNIPVVNAFALPGGHVVIFRELLSRADAPDEVAGVLAHELGHVAKRHAEAQLIRSLGMELLLSLATGGGSGGDSFGSFAGLLAILSYSRSAEAEADAFGLQTLANADIDPLGLKRFFDKIAKEEAGSWQGPFGKIGNMMSTHPVTADRMAAIEPLSGPVRPVLTDADWRALKAICR